MTEITVVIEPPLPDIEVTLAEVGLVGPTGPGVPVGGTTGQVLAKNSNTDYDTEWTDPAAGTGGSTVTVDADGTVVVDGTTVELATDTQLTAEATARAAADTAEATARASADTAEAAARVAADDALDARLDTVETDLPTRATTAALTSEASTRASADTALDGRLDTVEAALPTKADLVAGTVPDAQLHSSIARDTEVTAAVAAEAAARATAISTAINNLIASAPGTLDTLDELAAALGDDPNFATTVTTALAARQPLDADLTAIAALDSATAGALVTDGAGWFRKTYAQLKTALGLVKADVGLGNVDNTADSAKPVSTAQQAALDLKLAIASNLSDLANAATARTNLGLGTAATHAHGDYDAAGAAASAVAAHEADTTNVHGIADTSALALSADVVAKALYDAQTILAATTDNTPAALTVGVDTLVGRLTGGNIASLSVSQVRTLLGLTDENLQDLIGAMVSGGTETGISVTYDDTNGRFDFVVSGGGLPTGGAQGAALVKNSATDGDASFITPPWGGGDYFRSGYYSFGLASVGNLANGSPGAGVLTLRPFFVPVRRAFDRIGVNVTAAGGTGAVMRLGIYSPGAGVPGALLLDAGTVAGDSTGSKEITISQTLDAGVYWVAAAWQGGGSAGSHMAFPAGTISPATSMNTTVPGTGASNCGVLQNSVTGALPSSVTPAGVSQMPGVLLRAT